MKRIAFYGGSFDPLHDGHLAIARALTKIFALDRFVFVPAFHAPHKKDRQPTSAFHRFAMLALATADDPQIEVSAIELELPERPYTVETLTRLKNQLPETEIFFVMGADSWADILTWREWQTVLTMVSIIVVTRPDYEISFSHVTDEIRARIFDLRIPDSKFQIPNSGNGIRESQIVNRESQAEKDESGIWNLESGIKPESGINSESEIQQSQIANRKSQIYITDAVQIDVSATEIRRKIKNSEAGWQRDVPAETAAYIEKYKLYL